MSIIGIYNILCGHGMDTAEHIITIDFRKSIMAPPLMNNFKIYEKYYELCTRYIIQYIIIR